MADWVCRRCGMAAYDHSLPGSTCIWEPMDTDWLAEQLRQASEKAWGEGLAKATENSYLARNGLVPNPYASPHEPSHSGRES